MEADHVKEEIHDFMQSTSMTIAMYVTHDSLFADRDRLPTCQSAAAACAARGTAHHIRQFYR